MAEWIWLREDVIRAIHHELLAEHGGKTGLRDHRLLERALVRPRDIAQSASVDGPRLAAAYAFGLARINPFADGNKRVAAVAALLFLAANGIATRIGEAELAVMVLGIVAGDLDEKAAAGWLRRRVV